MELNRLIEMEMEDSVDKSVSEKRYLLGNLFALKNFNWIT